MWSLQILQELFFVLLTSFKIWICWLGFVHIRDHEANLWSETLQIYTVRVWRLCVWGVCSVHGTSRCLVPRDGAPRCLPCKGAPHRNAPLTSESDPNELDSIKSYMNLVYICSMKFVGFIIPFTVSRNLFPLPIILFCAQNALYSINYFLLLN